MTWTWKTSHFAFVAQNSINIILLHTAQNMKLPALDTLDYLSSTTLDAYLNAHKNNSHTS